MNMPCTLEFRRAVFNWEGDDHSQLYELLRSKFQLMPEAEREDLEAATASSLKYTPTDKKCATALLFLQNKEFTTPCVNESAPAYVPCTLEFRRAVFNWKGDDHSQLYELLRSKFQLMSEAEREDLEAATASSLKYTPTNKKSATALLFLQNKEFTAPCVDESVAVTAQHKNKSRGVWECTQARPDFFSEEVCRETAEQALTDLLKKGRP
jgi:hypothetical protein